MGEPNEHATSNRMDGAGMMANDLLWPDAGRSLCVQSAASGKGLATGCGNSATAPASGGAAWADRSDSLGHLTPYF